MDADGRPFEINVSQRDDLPPAGSESPWCMRLHDRTLFVRPVGYRISDRLNDRVVGNDGVARAAVGAAKQ